MNKRSSTKKALTASIMSMALCTVLLIGTTFAWFTDSVSSGTNVIKAGNLEISATYQDTAATGTTYNIPGFTRNGGDVIFGDTKVDINENNSIISEELWEPGAVGAKLITVKNDGSLAAQIKLDFTTTDKGLQSALWFDFIQVGTDNAVTGTFTEREMSTLSTFAKNIELPLMPKGTDGDSVSFIMLYGMKEDAGNEYMNAGFEADVTILATQYTYEEDSFGTDYDQSATLNFKHVSTYEDINGKLEDGKTYVVSGDVTGTNDRASALYFNKCDTTLQLSGSNITIPQPNRNSSVAAISVTGSNTKLTIIGSGTVNGSSGAADTNVAVKVRNGATVAIKGGTYTTGADATGNGNSVILADGGHVEIYDGFFYTDTMANGLYWVLNCQDNTGSSIKVYGGTFVNFNPADNKSDGENTNYVADGYKVVAETQANGDVWYTVVKDL